MKSHNKLTDHIEIHFLELPKFTLKDMRKIRASEAWIAYFSGKYSKEELEEIAMTTPAIKEAVEFEDTFLQNKIERRAYEQREKAIRDYYSYMSAFKEEGLEQGLQEGITLGMKKANINTAINLLKLGVDVDTIVKGTGLSIQDVEALKIKIK